MLGEIMSLSSYDIYLLIFVLCVLCLCFLFSKVRFENVTTNATIKQGEDIRLICDDRNNGTRTWTRDGIDIKQSKRVKIEDHVLIISNASTDDAATYVCKLKISPTHQKTLTVNLWVEVTINVKLALRVLNWNFTANMSNKSSKEFKEFEVNFKEQMNLLYKNFTGYEGVEILELFNGSVRVRYRVIIIVVITKKGEKVTKYKVEVTKRLIERAKTGKVNNLIVDKRPEFFETTSPPPPPSDFKDSEIYDNRATFTWTKPENHEYFDIKGYVIEYWKFNDDLNKERTKPSQGDAIEVGNLESDSGYSAHIVAKNTHGDSDESKKIEFKTKERKLKEWEIALIVLACVILLIMIIAIIICCRRKQKQETAKEMFPMKNRKSLEDTLYYNDNDVTDLRSYTNHHSNDHIWKKFSKEKLVLLAKIGEGEFGSVFKGQLLEDDTTKECAVKTLRDPNYEEGYRDLFKELEMMASVGYHPHLVNLIGAVCEKDVLYVIVEFASNGSLLEYLKNENHVPFDYSKRLSIALDVAKGMAFLERKRCIHRDLAARNVLLDENLQAKVADFGMSRDIYESGVYEKSTAGKLPTRWMALESLELRRFNIQSDVWAFGVLLWEIETNGLVPYGATNFKGLIKFLKNGNRLEKPPVTPDELYRFMNLCWSADPGSRPSFARICDILTMMLGVEDKGYQNTAYDEF